VDVATMLTAGSEAISDIDTRGSPSASVGVQSFGADEVAELE
jgi:hypothetical protein